MDTRLAQNRSCVCASAGLDSSGMPQTNTIVAYCWHLLLTSSYWLQRCQQGQKTHSTCSSWMFSCVLLTHDARLL